MNKKIVRFLGVTAAGLWITILQDNRILLVSPQGDGYSSPR
jgi:hypothetical protein